VTDPVSTVLVSCVVAFVANSFYFVLIGFRQPGWKCLAWVTVGTLLFWHAGGMGSGTPVPSWLIQGILVVVVLLAAGRYADHRLIKLGLFVGSLTLAGTIAINAAVVALTTPAPVVGPQETISEFEFVEHPDIYLVILDGYARSDVIQRLFNYDNSSFEASLNELGFEVYSEAKANYPITHFSIPSLLEMSYMHQGNGPISNSDLAKLAGNISGDNATVRTVKANGYRYVHGETITQYNHCGEEVDVCLKGPFLDVTMYRLLQNTPIGGLFYRGTGDPATWLNVKRIAQMRDWNVTTDLEGQPNFVLLHLILPHPPLFLDRHCQPRIDPDFRGSEMIRDDIPEDRNEKRMEAWIEQVECANQTTINFLHQLDEDDVVIVTSDHGSDATYRLFGNVTQYTDEQLAERIPTFTAARLPEDCRGAIPQDVTLVNLSRYIFACLADEPADSPPQPPRAAPVSARSPRPAAGPRTRT
jgi:hypothetical protein